MAEFVKVCAASDVQPGTKKCFKVDKLQVLVANVGGNYYAINNICPHMGGDLSAGKLEGTVVTCPRHGSQFDVTDGRLIKWAAQMNSVVSFLGKMVKRPRSAQAFKVKVENGLVMMEKPAKAK